MINRSRYVYALSKKGFITPCDLLVKVNPDLNNGLEVIGIVTPVQSNLASACTLLVEGDNAIIAGVTEKVYQRYGIHPVLAYGLHPDDQQLSLLQLFRGNFESLEEATKDDKLCLDITKLKNSSLIPSHYWRLKHLPERIKHKSRFIRLKLEKVSESSFGVPGLKIIELRLLEIKENYNYLGSVIFRNENPDQVKNTKDAALEKRQKKGDLDADFEADIQSYEMYEREQTALSEEELERLNMKAEKERRLKEQKANLKNQSTSRSIIRLYITVVTFVMSICIAALVIMTIQDTRNKFFDLGLAATYNLNLRAALIPQAAFLSMKLNLHKQ